MDLEYNISTYDIVKHLLENGKITISEAIEFHTTKGTVEDLKEFLKHRDVNSESQKEDRPSDKFLIP